MPRAPREDSDARNTRYLVMMVIRVICFILMATITPFGWYTWVFAVGAVFLPYVAVIIANVGRESDVPERELPDRELAAESEKPTPQAEAPAVFRITESPKNPENPT
nr:DUF3099 domain-containing protein [Microbacterium endophyticum]